MKRVLLLIGGTLLFWVLVGLPARRFGGGELATDYSLMAALLCLIPAAGTLAWAELTFRHQPEQQGLVFMGGMVIRMFFVVGATVVLSSRMEFFRRQDGFTIWVATFYLFVLALETILFTTGRRTPPSASGKTPNEPLP